MDIAFVDGLDHYNASLAASAEGGVGGTWILSGSWGSNTYVTGLSGFGRALRIVGSSTSNPRMTRAFAATTKISFAFAFKFETIDIDTDQQMLEIKDSSGALQFGIWMTALGQLGIKNAAGTLLATSDKQFNANVTYRCCLNADMTNANATDVHFYVTGEQDDGLTGVYDAQSTAIQNMGGVTVRTRSQLGQTAPAWIIDDLFMGINEIVNLGELELYFQGPTADLTSDWTPLSGTDNFAMVDEEQTDGDTTYNSSDTPAQKDIFEYPDLTRVPDNIRCLSVVTCIRKEESGTRTFRNILVSDDAVEYPGADQNLSQTYQYMFDHWQENPNGDVPWDAAAYNLVASGYENRV